MARLEFSVKVRLTGNSRDECEAARAWLKGQLSALELEPAREGSNPKYEGNQKWFSYGDLSLPLSELALAEGALTKPARARRTRGKK